MKTPSSRSLRRVAYVFWGISLLAVLTILIAPIIWRLRLTKAVNARLRAIKAAGFPTNGMELNRWYASVPDEQNAALVLTQAFRLMCTFPDERSNNVARLKLPPRGRHLTSGDETLLKDYVALNAAALTKVRESLTLPKSRFPVDLAPGPESLLPHLGTIK